MSETHSRRCAIGECWSQRHVLTGWSADAERYAVSEARAILAESEAAVPGALYFGVHAPLGPLPLGADLALAEALRAFVDAPSAEVGE